MRKILVAVSIAASVVLAGCAVSAGNEALKDQSQTTVGNSIVEGKSTKADVQAAFGSANKVSFTDAGLEIWNYEFDHATPYAINYVPVLNLLAHGAKVEKKTLTVLFRREGHREEIHVRRKQQRGTWRHRPVRQLAVREDSRTALYPTAIST